MTSAIDTSQPTAVSLNEDQDRPAQGTPLRQNDAMDDDEVVGRLLKAMGQYGPYYDEVFWQINAHICEQGEAGKLELAALICWKRSGQGHWVSDLMELPDAEVRERSRAALATGLTDQQRLDFLAPLPGFRSKSALATAVLACNDPDEFGVLDWRALEGLQRIDRPIKRGRGETLRYLNRVRELRDLTRGSRRSVTARNIDQGLWFIGGQ